MRRRFFVEKFDGQRALVAGDRAHHLGVVLRAQAGQLYELSDGVRVCLGRIEKVARDSVEFALLEELSAEELRLQVTLLLSVVKFDAFEWAIEKATELGVMEIVPVAATRSEKALVAAAEKRSERWRKIVLEAAQQSRRVRLPVLHPVVRPDVAFAARAERDKFYASVPTVMVMEDSPTPRESFILKRGAYDAHGERVTPAVPAWVDTPQMWS